MGLRGRDKDVMMTKPPSAKCPASVKITDTKTGESRIYLDDWFDGELQVWAYQEGNYSCDCNRYLFFQRAANADEDDEDIGCGDDRFVIDSIFWQGKIWYSELDTPPPLT
jgi:hypothetical protein